MSRYRRANIEGGTFFFTVTLADRSSDLLVRHIDDLRQAYQVAQKLYPFDTIAICILPDHVHAVWTLPSDDADFPLRWRLIKSNFSRAVPAEAARTESKIRKREKGIWQRRYWEHDTRRSVLCSSPVCGEPHRRVIMLDRAPRYGTRGRAMRRGVWV